MGIVREICKQHETAVFFSIFYCGCKLPKSIHLFSPAKIVQGERKCKFTCNFPSRSLSSACKNKLKQCKASENASLKSNFFFVAWS